MTTLAYDNLNKTWVFVCFLKKLTKILEKKMFKEVEKNSVKWEINTWRRNGLVIFRDEASLFQRSAVYLLALFFSSDLKRKLFKNRAVIFEYHIN